MKARQSAFDVDLVRSGRSSLWSTGARQPPHTLPGVRLASRALPHQDGQQRRCNSHSLICRHGKPVADLLPHRKHSRLEPQPADWFAVVLEAHDMTVLPFHLEVCIRSTEVPSMPADPYNRMIIAAAQVHHLPVVTTDTIFLQYGIAVIS